MLKITGIFLTIKEYKTVLVKSLLNTDISGNLSLCKKQKPTEYGLPVKKTKIDMDMIRYVSIFL